MSATQVAREELALRAVLFACQQDAGTLPLPEDLMTALGRLVPCDEYAFEGLDSSGQGGYLRQQLDEQGSSRFAVSEAGVVPGPEPFWVHYWSSMPCCYPEATGDRSSVTRISDFYSDREWWFHPMRTEYLEDVRHEMMLCLDDGGSRTARLLFFRSSGGDFSERHRMLLSLLRPHIEQAYRGWQHARQAGPRLTARQLELVGLVARGLTNRQIARELGLSEGTVRTHLFNVYERLGVSSRTAAVMRVVGGAPAGGPEVTPRQPAAATR